MNNLPFFSLILPIYKVDEYIGECLDSLLYQTFRDIEIICVIDGSPDNSKDICDQYATADSRIKVIYQENAGASSARNNGLLHAQGKYIHFVDPDDKIHDQYVYEKLYATLSDFGSDVIVVGSVYYEDTFDNQTEVGITKEAAQDAKNSLEYVLENKWFFALTSGVNKIYKREMLLENNLFWPLNVINEDDRWLPQVMNISRSITFISLPVYDVRRRGGSLTSTKSPEWLQRRGTGNMDTAIQNCNLIANGEYSSQAKSNGMEYYIQLYFSGLKLRCDNGGGGDYDPVMINYMGKVGNIKMKLVYYLAKVLGYNFAVKIMKRRYQIG